MRILVVDNAHIFKTNDGKYFSKGIYDNQFFNRYLSVFEEVRFCCKVKLSSDKEVEGLEELNHFGLEIWELPWFRGLFGLLKNLFKLIFKLRLSFKGMDVHLYRMTQIESVIAYLVRKKRPYAVEVVNDPSIYYRFPLNLIYVVSKRIIYNANGASYITENVLQEKYPSFAKINGSTRSHFDSVFQTLDLDEKLIKPPKKIFLKNNEMKLIHVANNIENDLKGHKIVISVVKILVNKGYNVKCDFVGDGSKVKYFLKFAEKKGVSNYINFVGRIDNKEKLINFMNLHDLFILPSKAEGLGRVNLEAMASALPCIASRTGGIVELFDNQYLFDYHDTKYIAELIISLYKNPKRLSEMSINNTNNVRRFTNSVQSKKRFSFYTKLKNLI